MGKSQVSLEFIILIGMAFVFFTAFLVVIQQITADKQRESNYQMFYDLAKSVQEQLITVSQSESGLIVVYELPAAEFSHILEKHSCTITNTNTSLTVRYSENAINLPIPPTVGNLTLGQNILKNIGGVVYVE